MKTGEINAREMKGKGAIVKNRDETDREEEIQTVVWRDKKRETGQRERENPPKKRKTKEKERKRET